MKFISRRLSVKIALGINLIVLTLTGITAYLFITFVNVRLENEAIIKAQEKSLIGAKMIGTVIEEAADNGVFSIKDAFDTNYTKIGDITPARYHTKYDTYLDKAILKLQDEFLKDKSVLFAVATDRNGYLPTHNSRYQKNFTGDMIKDTIGNRTKRMFTDDAGKKAAQNLTPGFVQTYHRDTGEILWDISSPIYVKGKHWGSFRLAISPKNIDQEKMALSFKLYTILFSVFIPFFILTFIVLHQMLLPVKKLTKTITELSVAQHLKTPIKTKRIDEIGELHLAVEDLRRSMVRILELKKRPQTKPVEETDNPKLREVEEIILSPLPKTNQ